MLVLNCGEVHVWAVSPPRMVSESCSYVTVGPQTTAFVDHALHNVSLEGSPRGLLHDPYVTI